MYFSKSKWSGVVIVGICCCSLMLNYVFASAAFWMMWLCVSLQVQMIVYLLLYIGRYYVSCHSSGQLSVCRWKCGSAKPGTSYKDRKCIVHFPHPERWSQIFHRHYLTCTFAQIYLVKWWYLWTDDVLVAAQWVNDINIPTYFLVWLLASITHTHTVIPSFLAKWWTYFVIKCRALTLFL